MTLYELAKVNGNDLDIDTYDEVYDAIVTVCIYIPDDGEEEFYDKFCMEIIKKINIVKVNNDGSVIADWHKLIENNMEKFKVFAREHWIFDYEDDEGEFVYQWIKEMHYYLAGYVSEDIYEKLVALLENLN